MVSRFCLHFDATELGVDFAGALARGSAVPLAVESFLGIVVTQPLVPRRVQFTTVDPQIGVRTGIRAQFA